MTLHTILVSGELRNIPELPPQTPKYHSELWYKKYSESFNGNPDQDYQIDVNKYERALESAKNNAIPYEDQVWAKTLIQYHFDDPNFEIKEGEIYSIEYAGRTQLLKCLIDGKGLCRIHCSCREKGVSVSVRLIPEVAESQEPPKAVIDFAQWYSGMERQKVIKAYNRYQIETRKTP
jgi:hypothetical protein